MSEPESSDSIQTIQASTISVTTQDALGLMTLPESYITEIFNAYGLSTNNLTLEQKNEILVKMSRTKRTFPYLREVVMSNRYPQTITLLASKVGMYIPPRKRAGLLSYHHYLHNIRYYEPVLSQHPTDGPPSLYSIHMSKNKVEFLLKYRDDEILRPDYFFSRNFEDRREMIENFISRNVNIYGHFYLEPNSRTSYVSRTKVILYKEAGNNFWYSVDELSSLVDTRNNVIWKNSERKEAFTSLSLHHLRLQIMEKFSQWMNRDENGQFTGPSNLYNLLEILTLMLQNEQMLNKSSYFINPKISL